MIRAIRFVAPHQIQTVQLPGPSLPKTGQALVKTHSVGVCGTDASAYRGTFPFFDFPRIPGQLEKALRTSLLVILAASNHTLIARNATRAVVAGPTAVSNSVSSELCRTVVSVTGL